MTQSSRPQAGNKDPIYGNPAYVDAGPWSRDEWAKKLIIEWVGDYVTTRGPFAKYLNRLEVTNPAGVSIQVDTGAGYCGGSLLDNTVAVTFTPNTPGIAARTDKVVLVENNTNVAYTGALSGVILDFPTVLTDYSGAASVPPYACRLAILRGDAATGNPTALIQSADYWMIELYRFTISNVPAISALTDNRDYVDAEMKTRIIPAVYGYNDTDATNHYYIITAFTAGGALVMTDAKYFVVDGITEVPTDLVDPSTLYVEAMLVPGAVAGNIYAKMQTQASKCGEAIGVRFDQNAFAAEAIAAAGTYGCHRQLQLSNADIDDIVRLQFVRDATDVLDTVDADMYFIAFKLEYLGWRVA